jgi:hypothetical protein
MCFPLPGPLGGIAWLGFRLGAARLPSLDGGGKQLASCTCQIVRTEVSRRPASDFGSMQKAGILGQLAGLVLAKVNPSFSQNLLRFGQNRGTFGP